MSGSQSTVEYREIPGFPAYRVGSDGSIWSRWGRGPDAPLRATWHRRSIRYRDKKRYLQVMLTRSPNVRKEVLVHKLVAEIFHGPCPPGLEIRHLDGDKHNNAAGNLAYGTHSENMRDTVLHGSSTRGERSANAKLTEDIVREIRNRRGKGEYITTLGREYGLHHSTISSLFLRKSWAHVP